MTVNNDDDDDGVKVGTENRLDWPSLMCVFPAHLKMGRRMDTNPSQLK